MSGDILVRTGGNTGKPLTRVDTNGNLITVVETNELYYVKDTQGNLVGGTKEPSYKNIYDQDGNVIGVEEIPSDDATVTDNVIYGSTANDQINGLSGNDALSGGAGNDQINGGTGDDMIGGGSGSDNIQGGDGTDFISSAADIQSGLQQMGANDQWTLWGQPGAVQVIGNGSTWGVFLEAQSTDTKESFWSGIRETPNKDIIFTGHSLGGGLAGIMAVWFNRTAVVFDSAQSQITATYGPSVSSVIDSLGADAPQSIKKYPVNTRRVCGGVLSRRRHQIHSDLRLSHGCCRQIC